HSRGPLFVAFWCCLLLGGCRAQVADHLDDEALRQFVGQLSAENIAYEVESSADGASVFVDREDAPEALRIALGVAPRETETAPSRPFLRDLILGPRVDPDQRLAGQVELVTQALMAYDGVVEAHVQLAVEQPLETGALAVQSASILLVCSGVGPTPSDPEAQALVAGGIPGLSDAQVEVVRIEHQEPPSTVSSRSAQPPSDLTAVGPFWVSPDSAKAVRSLLFVLLGLIVVLSGAVVVLVVKRQRPTGPA
ncbi:MAG: hypothetical protein KC561_12625, partial [Myxococcales bacterium]|nr:hypothetical protein [Myxococcales bacterium]